MTFREFIKSLNKEGVEGELVKTIFISLVASFFILGILYFVKLKYIEDFISNYGFYLFFVILSYALIISSARQIRAYKHFSCMTGMMIGMTIGMIAGFLSGFYIGATNGMFWGSVFGIGIGMVFGIENGKCCGIMGVMEGMMAGFMGGIMGAMTSLMMFNDNLRIAGIIVFLISGIIITGLSFMVFKETREAERKHRDDGLSIIFWSIVLTGITAWMMVLGPRSVLFQ